MRCDDSRGDTYEREGLIGNKIYGIVMQDNIERKEGSSKGRKGERRKSISSTEWSRRGQKRGEQDEAE